MERSNGKLRKFKRYPEYRDSGVEWLGEIPAHWEVKRLKRIFKVLNGATPNSGESAYWGGEIPWVTPEDLGNLLLPFIKVPKRYITVAGLNSCGTSIVPKGSLILSTRAPIGHTAIAGVDLCTNQGCRSLVFRNKDDTSFFHYHIAGLRRQLQSLGQGSTFQELASDNLENIALCKPPIEEQRALSKFLDRETARIDTLIRKKERLIELLQEKRTALITHAVTKGLDPDVPKKDSGVEWLGEIPEHWDLVRLRYMIEKGVQNGLFKKKDNFGSGNLLINVFDVYQEDFIVRKETLDRVETDEKETPAYSVNHGDIFFVRSSLKLEGVGRSACAVDVSETTVFECHLVRVRPINERVMPEYLVNYLNCKRTTQRLVSLANTVTMTTIDQDKIASLEIPFPPLAEQKQILTHIQRESGTIRHLLEKIRIAVEFLKEYRTALISEAVTGKIDVRDQI